ncbi:ATP-binding protein [Yinghuangia sp. ASG 101]|uniref:ATP-binding protein n=1 Tax=Yinghuangia sp. ASG 101 TaxID=2896848 RepID=UPI001E47A31B|nr:ATP-binding protein [Yinghuangia sp. ASG 101]UGQ09740.1 ATP-binding protein [Yinghuangia sp. ASG 101]
MNPGEGVSEAVARLWYDAHDARLPLHLPGADEARRTRRELVAQIDDYVLPRLRRPEAPLLAAVAGPTGAGRSTLVNSLIGREVSPAGVLRPTTRVPVLVCRASERHWFAGARVLPGLRRVAGGPRPAGEGPSLVLHVDDRVPAGLAVLDVPGVDAVDADRDLAARLLGAADVWLFVTTPSRYADAVPWHLLRVARERTTEIGIVLNRVGVGEFDEVRGHFAALLENAGLGRVPLFVLPEVPLVRHMLSRGNIAPVRNWLYERATRPAAREAAVHRTLGGALRSLPARAEVVARAATRQHAAAATLARCVERVYAAAHRHLDSALRAGEPLSGETLARWRAWHADGLPGPDAPAIERALADAVATLLRDVAERAAEVTERCWRGRPGGAELIARTGGHAWSRASGVFAPGPYGAPGPSPEAPRAFPGYRGAVGPGGGVGRRFGSASPAPLVVADTIAGGDAYRDVLAAGSPLPGGSPADAAAETVAAWLGETAARVPDGAAAPRSDAVLVVVAALGPTHGDGTARSRAEVPRAAHAAARRAHAALTPELAAHIAPVRAALRERAGAFVDAERELRLRAVRVLRTNAGRGVEETDDAAPGAG